MSNQLRRPGFLETVKAPLRKLVRRQLHERVQRRVDRAASRVGLHAAYRAGDPHDAFTHAYVSAWLTIILGPGIAERIGDLNEQFGSLAVGETLDARMDRHNNAIGREIAERLRRDGTACDRRIAECVKIALDAGRLQVIGPNQRGEPSLVPSEPRWGRPPNPRFGDRIATARPAVH